jgi:hypothetical protein
MQTTMTLCGVETLESRRLLSDMVLRWNQITIDVLRADTTLPGPGWSSRNMAIASLAVFDAVNSIDKSYDPYLIQVPGVNHNNTSMDAAIASAAHAALVRLYPQQRTLLDAELEDSLEDVPDGLKERRGVLLGKLVGAAMVLSRKHDGASREVEYTVNPDPGHWSPDPINPLQQAWGPGWGQVRPFALRSGKQFRAPPPPMLDSAAYAAAFNEVKSLGEKDSTTRTPEQTEIGIFWGYDRAGTGTPPALYCQATEVLAVQQQNTVVENARLFALVNVAQADAGIAAWDSKYKYDHWRPVTAIRRAAEDGNPATEADLDWEPLGAPGNAAIPNFTPPFPAYVSGHATFGAAVFKVLANFYGSDQMQYTLTSDELPGVSRDYTSFSQAAAENARSRIYLGIHWNYDDSFGQEMGRKVADWTTSHVLEPHGDRVHAGAAPSWHSPASGSGRADSFFGNVQLESGAMWELDESDLMNDV